jgi:hypothetical protein
MLLAALLDAGAPAEALTRIPGALGLDGVRVEISPTERHGVGATQVRIVTPREEPTRSPADLLAAIAAAGLSDRVRERASAAVTRLAEAEAAVHRVPVEDLHLHELGSADTLVDLCGVFALLEALGAGDLACSALPFARGLVRSAHGVLPSPAPAVLALLPGGTFVGVDGEAELVTPTGAAVVAVAATAWGRLPMLRLEAVGYGAGTRDLPDRPNVLRVVLGETPAREPHEVVLLETNLDDLLPELIPDAIERCVAAGALDVWTAPAQMKKGRPGSVLSALARPEDETAVARALLTHTSTLGVRVSTLRRHELEREHAWIEVEGHRIGVKLGLLDGRVVNVAPEHDDCARAAEALGFPVKQVWAKALVAAEELRAPAG